MKSSPEVALSAAVAASMARRQSAWAAPTVLLETDEFPAKTQPKRRKSWHSRLERRRRKGVVMAVGGSDPHAVAAAAAISSMNATAATVAHTGHTKQKRPSWWNIFVPDHWPRPRRASQDVSRTSTGEPVVPWLRSKSRSVDHGFSTPFDLDSLRSKVEGRFEAVQGEGVPTTGNFTDGTESGKEAGTGGRMAPKNAQPFNTVPYTVEANDTLTSVAARFDTTPSELAKLNRLPQRLPLFPGQVLYIPAERAAGRPTPGNVMDSTSNSDTYQLRRPSDPTSDDVLAPGATTAAGATDLPWSDGAADQERELLDSLRPASPLPPGAGRVRTPSGGDLLGTDYSSLGSCACPARKAPAVPERFLRINVRHITDGQGVVGGVLLVTPNAVMFDPNVSDPLVIEHGPESYGVIAPMEFVVNAAIYHDIAHMRVRHMPDTPRTDLPKPVIYHIASLNPAAGTEDVNLVHTGESETDAGTIAAASENSPAKDECFPELAHHTSSSNSPENDETSLFSCENPSTEPPATTELTVIPREGGAFPKAFERDLVTPTAHLVEATEEGSKADDKVASIYDSGIDMRDNAAATAAAQTIAEEDPTVVESEDKTSVTAAGGPRKKASSVSFCELEKEIIPDATDKQESRKTKVFKRLSYPLTWMEGLGGEKESMNPSGPNSSNSSQPGSADSKESHHSSVFSKVFSSSPLSLVDLGSTLFVKEPSSSPNLLVQAGPSSDPSLPKAIFEFPPTSDSIKAGRSSMDVARRHHQETAVHRASVAGPGPKLDYRSMVSVEDMPELFVSFDKLIPRPARPCDDPPLYLRLRMGKPINKRIPKSTPIMSYGKKKMRPEYWFSVPRNRVDDLYRFLQLWVPQLYGELEDMDPAERGFELVDSDTELWADDEPDAGRSKGNSGSTSSAGEIAGELTRESWEVLSMSEELRRALYAAGGSAAGSFDLDVFGLPELVGTSEILSDPHRARLVRHLPARAEGYPWTLVFSTSLHGFSLNSMFRKMAKIESPILLVCQDTENNVFGALTSCALKVSDHFYGTGESFLFRFTPPATPEPSPTNSQAGSPSKEESSPVSTPAPTTPAPVGALQVFDWSGDNIYFIKGNNESLAIGAGDGKFGLWLDGDLYQGRTQPCSTYSNVALVDGEDFVVKTLECWAFV